MAVTLRLRVPGIKAQIQLHGSSETSVFKDLRILFATYRYKFKDRYFCEDHSLLERGNLPVIYEVSQYFPMVIPPLKKIPKQILQYTPKRSWYAVA
jgi:hypothetical protein